MTATSGVPMEALSARVRWSGCLLSATSVLFAAGLVVQLFFAGMGVFVGPGWWMRHRDFVHVFEWLAPLAVILVYLARAARRTKWLAWLTVLLVYVQYLTADFRLTPNRQSWAAFHPISAALLFWAGVQLASDAGTLARRRWDAWRVAKRLGTAGQASRFD